MDYDETFLRMLQFLQLTYNKFPKFMIEIMAEKYGIPLKEIKPLMLKFRKKGILQILKEEGYINEYSVSETIKPILTITLKYYLGKPVISSIKRVSKPGLRIYKAKDNLPKVLGGLGVAIISTSKGLKTDRQARKDGYGGEVLCFVS